MRCVQAQDRQDGDPVVAGDGGGLLAEELCGKYDLIPLNREYLISQSAGLVAEHGITSCSAENLINEGVGGCLFDLGFEGLQLIDADGDWDCTTPTDASTCYGLECDNYHIGEHLLSLLSLLLHVH